MGQRGIVAGQCDHTAAGSKRQGNRSGAASERRTVPLLAEAATDNHSPGGATPPGTLGERQWVVAVKARVGDDLESIFGWYGAKSTRTPTNQTPNEHRVPVGSCQSNSRTELFSKPYSA